MTEPDQHTPSAPLRDPHDWKTGNEPLTASQKSYLLTLATEAGEEVSDVDALTKSEAALRIESLQQKTGRGGNAPQSGGLDIRS